MLFEQTQGAVYDHWSISFNMSDLVINVGLAVLMLRLWQAE
eukprot:CAMPEP_0170216588 /NCGR_PEP_ID=MMETSP0116_2-20130129/7957_1 /TAXON_ID=400756 /ORGANISM="Durinskia baltica, Strain CSIRO CS-38" /LENGTH=40 /DNA_ID= /DNA_START= /DNA_END= /DNA_ORIENTATION=